MTSSTQLFLVTGIMAAGKSTVSDALARRFDRGVHVRGDTFRRFVVSGREETSADPSVDAVAQREAARRKIAYTGFTPADLDDELRERTPRLGLWVDSTELTVEETVDVIVAQQASALV